MRKPSQAGYALLTVIFILALIALALSVAMPSARTRGQREMELELIFRGEQYKRAIGLFYRKHNRFPMKIEELLRTNDRSYLRKEWPDPMTPDGKWRFIRLGPGGRKIGSVDSPKAPDPLGRRKPGSSGGSSARSSSGPGGYPIIGVASRSRERSFRVYEDADTYYGWEFIYDPKDAAKLAGQGGRQNPNAPVNPLGRRTRQKRR